MKPKGHKGQGVTLFIVLGIVILAVVGLLFGVRNAMQDSTEAPLGQADLDATQNSLEKQIDICLMDKVREGMDYYGALPDAQEQIRAYVEREVPRCVDLVFYESQGLTIKSAAFSANVLVSSNAVIVGAQYPLEIADADGTAKVRDFGYNVEIVTSEELSYDAGGRIIEDVSIISGDGDAQLFIPAGARVLTDSGEPVDEITLELIDKTEGGMSNSHILGEIIYDIQPDGVRFSPPAELTISYLPGHAIGPESSLTIAYFDEARGFWRSLPSYVDTGSNTVTALITHLTNHALTENCGRVEKQVLPPEIVYQEPCYRPCGLGAFGNPEEWDGCWKTTDYDGNDNQVYATPDMTDVLLRGIDDAIYATEDHITTLGLGGSNGGESQCGEPLPITTTSEGFEQVGSTSGVSAGEAIVAVRCSDSDDCEAQKERVNSKFGFTDEDWDNEGQPGIPNDRCYDQENILDWDKDDKYENICVCVKSDNTPCSSNVDTMFKTHSSGGNTWQEICTVKNQEAAQEYYDDNYATLDSFQWLIAQYGDDIILNKDGIQDGKAVEEGGVRNGAAWEGGCACTATLHQVEVGKKDNPAYDPIYNPDEPEFLPVYEDRIKTVNEVPLRDNPQDEDESDYGGIASPNYYGYMRTSTSILGENPWDGAGGVGYYEYFLQTDGDTCVAEGYDTEITVECDNYCLVEAMLASGGYAKLGECSGVCTYENRYERAGNNRIRIRVRNDPGDVCSYGVAAHAEMRNGTGLNSPCPDCVPLTSTCECGSDVVNPSEDPFHVPYCINSVVYYSSVYDPAPPDDEWYDVCEDEMPCPVCVYLDSSYDGCYCGSRSNTKDTFDHYCEDGQFYIDEPECDSTILPCPPCEELTSSCQCGSEKFTSDTGKYCDDGAIVNELPPECTTTGGTRRFNGVVCTDHGVFHYKLTYANNEPDNPPHPPKYDTYEGMTYWTCGASETCNAEVNAPGVQLTSDARDYGIVQMYDDANKRTCGSPYGNGGNECAGNADDVCFIPTCQLLPKCINPGGCSGDPCPDDPCLKNERRDSNCNCVGQPIKTCGMCGNPACPDPCAGCPKSCCHLDGCSALSKCKSGGGDDDDDGGCTVGGSCTKNNGKSGTYNNQCKCT